MLDIDILTPKLTGPISPHELHVNDPEFYDQLYGTKLKLDMNSWITKQFGNQLSTMGRASHNLHKLRRKAIAPFLSSNRIIQLEGLITSKIEKLCDLFIRARDFKTTSKSTRPIVPGQWIPFPTIAWPSLGISWTSQTLGGIGSG